MKMQEAIQVVRREAYQIYQMIGYEVFGDSNPEFDDVRDVVADCFEANCSHDGKEARAILICDDTFETTVGDGIRRHGRMGEIPTLQ